MTLNIKTFSTVTFSIAILSKKAHCVALSIMTLNITTLRIMIL
jgi:hypothetical protein